MSRHHLFQADEERQNAQALPFYFFDNVNHDGRIRASGMGKIINISDCGTQEILFQLEGHTTSISCVAFSSDSRFLVSAALDKTIKLWDLNTQQCLHTAIGRTDKITHIAFSPDNRWILSGMQGDGMFDQQVQLEILRRDDLVPFSKREGEWTTSGSDDGAYCWISPSLTHVAINADGSEIISGSEKFVTQNCGDKMVIDVWPQSAGKNLHQSVGNSSLFHPPGDFSVMKLAGPLKVWDLKRGYCSHDLVGHHGTISSCKFSPDGKQLATVAWDNKLKIWDFETGLCLTTFAYTEPAEKIWDIAFSRDGKYLKMENRTYGENYRMLRLVKIVDCETWEIMRTFLDDKEGLNRFTAENNIQFIGKEPVRTMEFIGEEIVNADRAKVLTYSGKTFTLQNPLTNEVLLTVDNAHQDSISELAFSADGERIISACMKGELAVWDARNGDCLGRLSVKDGIRALDVFGECVYAQSHTSFIQRIDISKYTRAAVDEYRERRAAERAALLAAVPEPTSPGLWGSIERARAAAQLRALANDPRERYELQQRGFASCEPREHASTQQPRLFSESNAATAPAATADQDSDFSSKVRSRSPGQ